MWYYQWIDWFNIFQFILAEIQWFEFNTTTEVVKTIRNSIFTDIQLKIIKMIKQSTIIKP